MPDLSKLFSEFGLIGIIIGTLFFILFRMLMWVMAFIKDITKQHKEERETWLPVINGLKTSIELHNQSSIEGRKTTEEAHRYQREEHKQMIEVLGRINGYAK